MQANLLMRRRLGIFLACGLALALSASGCAGSSKPLRVQRAARDRRAAEDYRAAVTSGTQTLRADWAFAVPICAEAQAGSLCLSVLVSVSDDARVALDDLALITVPPTLIGGDLHLRSALRELAAATTKPEADEAWALLGVAFHEVGATLSHQPISDVTA